MAEFTLGADESAWFVLEVVMADGTSPSAHPDYMSDAFKETVNFWRGWIGRSTYKNRWRESGEPLRARAETAHVETARVDRGRTDVRVARDDRRRAQLGLPLFVDSRLVFHPLRAHAARLHGRGRGLHALGDGALPGAGARRLAPDHVRH